MTNTKSTKRALLAGLLILVMCVSMFVGTTFAWFTDTATTGSNVIQAGTLDIVLEYKDGDSWVNAEGKVLEFKKGGNYNGYVGDVLWEPGCTYELPAIRVRNEGNLTALVVLTVNGITGDEKLLEAIEFTTKVSGTPDSLLKGTAASTFKNLEANPVKFMYGTPDGTVLMDWNLAPKGHITPNTGHTDTTAEFTISGHMMEEAGNEYQGLKIEGVAITALATQGVYEYDSFGREYDAKAKDNLPKVVSNAAELAEVVVKDKATNTYTITNDVVPVDMAIFSDHTATEAYTVNGNGATVKGVATSVDAFQWEGGTIPYMSPIFSSANGSKVVVNDVTFTGTMSAIMLGHYQNATYNNYNTELNNVNVIDTKVVSFSSNVSPAVCVYGTAVLNNCNIYGTTLSELDTDPMWPVYDLVAVNYTDLTVNNSKVGSLLMWNQAKVTVADGTEVEKIVVLGNMNTTKYGLTVKAGAIVDTIDLSAITDKARVNITIEDGANVGGFVANGVTYATLADWQNA